eukprot:TRINITY_DN1873_c1_g1_i6.p1 TRINITY_DN1873_c1_g1~~TRINITY_DN1873_c1_g1_i6.p1  ORF type:complete len:209 (-),score=30.44 TRINITY_DN1873_c1_g1_i6:457-1083(-)
MPPQGKFSESSATHPALYANQPNIHIPQSKGASRKPLERPGSKTPSQIIFELKVAETVYNKHLVSSITRLSSHQIIFGGSYNTNTYNVICKHLKVLEHIYEGVKTRAVRAKINQAAQYNKGKKECHFVGNDTNKINIQHIKGSFNLEELQNMFNSKPDHQIITNPATLGHEETERAERGTGKVKSKTSEIEPLEYPSTLSPNWNVHHL